VAHGERHVTDIAGPESKVRAWPEAAKHAHARLALDVYCIRPRWDANAAPASSRLDLDQGRGDCVGNPGNTLESVIRTVPLFVLTVPAPSCRMAERARHGRRAGDRSDLSGPGTAAGRCSARSGGGMPKGGGHAEILARTSLGVC